MPITRRTTTIVEEEDHGSTQFPGFPGSGATDSDLLQAPDRMALSTRFPSPVAPENTDDSEGTSGVGRQPSFLLRDHWKELVSGCFVVICLLCGAVWYMSKQDADLQQAKQELKDLSGKVERLREEVTRQGTQIENLRDARRK